MSCADFSYLWGGPRVRSLRVSLGRHLSVRGRGDLPSLKKARPPAPKYLGVASADAAVMGGQQFGPVRA